MSQEKIGHKTQSMQHPRTNRAEIEERHAKAAARELSIYKHKYSEWHSHHEVDKADIIGTAARTLGNRNHSHQAPSREA